MTSVSDSVSDLAVNHSPVPVLVVPPMLAEERAATVSGPLLIAHDGSAGRSMIREALLGSVARAVLHHAHRPVLVVPSPP